MSSFIVVYDACVLYPFHLRDVLVRLAVSGMFQAKWTDAILDECFTSLRRNRPDLDPASLERTRRLMCTAVRDCLVTGYEPLVDGSFLTPMTDTCCPLPFEATHKSSSPGTSATSPQPSSRSSTSRYRHRTASCATSSTWRPPAWPRCSSSRHPRSKRPRSRSRNSSGCCVATDSRPRWRHWRSTGERQPVIPGTRSALVTGSGASAS